MSPTTTFLTGVSFAALSSVGIMAYVKTHLNALLIELCGTAERASFWLSFSNVTLVLVPLIFALDYKPESGPGQVFIFEMATQLKHAIFGFVLALSSLAVMLFRFIPRDKPNAAAGPTR